MVLNNFNRATGNTSSANNTLNVSSPNQANLLPKTKREIDAENAAQNGGVNRCTNCGIETVPGKRHQSGVTPPGNERHRDHIIPKAKGGDGTLENGQILCRTCNLNKRDKL